MPARTARSTSTSPSAAPTAVAEPAAFAGAHAPVDAPLAPLPSLSPTTQPGYRGLKVWQRGMDLAVAVYRATQDMGDDALRGELWRAAIDVPAHIAAGNVMLDRAAHLAELMLALGHVARLESLLQFAEAVGAITVGEAASLSTDAGNVGRMLRGLGRAVQAPDRGDATIN